MARSRNRNEVLWQLYLNEAKLNYLLHIFGDELARRKGYKQHQGIEAVHFFLVQAYNMTPATVKAMSHEDLRFLLAEEMSGWLAPEDAVFHDA